MAPGRRHHRYRSRGGASAANPTAHWKTSLRRIAKALDRPLELLPALYSALWPLLAQLHPVPTGMKLKTLQNHNVERALQWFARADGIPKRGAPLAPPWEALRARLDPGIPRYAFSSLMRFCSGRGVAPGEVDEDVIDRYILYRSQTGKAADVAYRRGLARAWNANVGKIIDLPPCLDGYAAPLRRCLRYDHYHVIEHRKIPE